MMDIPGVIVKPTLTRSFADELLNVAVNQLETSTQFKAPRMDKLKKYEELYAGKSNPKLRIQYDAVLPVFAGMVSSLEVEFDDPPHLKFAPANQSDYFSARKIQAAWENEAHQNVPSAMWDLKSRIDKHNAILSGRGILKFYSESDPEYKSVFDAVNYRDFHCEPNGGVLLENHLFAGQESIFRTQEALEEGALNGGYDKEQVKQLLQRASSIDYKDTIDQNFKNRNARFFALGLDPQSNNYVGQNLFNLCEWVMTYKGERWYLLFDVYTKTWVRCEKLVDIFSGGFYPWVSWATHEDDRVFWSKSYGDDFYPTAQTIVDLMMQEYTNRQKKLFGAKLYDPDMVVNPQDLNTAQYRPDQMVEIDTKNGARRIGDAIFEIPTGELGAATIDLVSWVESSGLRMSGAEDMTRVTGAGASSGKGAKANVVFAQIQAAEKRLSHKAHSFQEAYSQIGTRYIQGLKDDFSGSMPLKLLGPEGYEMDELKRIDLNTEHQLNIKVTSKREEDQQNVFGKNQKIQALGMVQTVNIHWKDEQILRHVGGFNEEDILEAMDTNTYGDKETLAKAAQAIDTLLKKKMPPLYMRANAAFMEKIFNYALDHKDKLKEKYPLFLQYVKSHTQIVAQNMAKLAQDVNAGRKPAPGMGATPAGQDQKKPAPSMSGNPQGNVAPVSMA